MEATRRRHYRRAWALAGWMVTSCAWLHVSSQSSALASDVPTLEVVEVTERTQDLLGVADSANVGTVTGKQLQAIPAYRPGELLEKTPGLIVTTHSGEGKANQYFLRGFNLDHGTDLAITVDGVPVNLRTHAHGQGYSDINFLIPELISGLKYKKGPYYSDEGDFSAAGAIDVSYVDTLPAGIAEAGLGPQGYRRALVAASSPAGAGSLLYALELSHKDGPWTHPDDFRKLNAVARYSQGTRQNGWDLTAMIYGGTWNSTDQIPKRAVDAGLIGRFDPIDPSDGGEAYRYGLSGTWRQTGADSLTQANAYAVASHLKLFNNFTFSLADPVHGDQFEQRDRRVLSGLNASRTWFGTWGGREMENTAGLQLRNDNINVGLFSTEQRQVLATTRDDHVVETSAGLFFENKIRWRERFRTVAGIRGDFYRANVTSNNPANSGSAYDHLISPKLGFIFGPWAMTEYYFNLGRGFHSNDARGVTITQDPKTGLPADKVPFLVRTNGIELGLRSTLFPHLQTSLALFRLDFDSELLFVGDAGTTEPSRPSRRVGIEWTNAYTPFPWLVLDADFAYTRARFTDPDPVGDRIPGAIEGMVSIGAVVDHLGPWYGALRLRHFGPRPLIEDNSVRSHATTLLAGQVGYQFDKTLRLQLEGFNLLNKRASQIDYFYTSRLPGEPPTGVADVHFHPVEPRSFRLSVIATF